MKIIISKKEWNRMSKDAGMMADIGEKAGQVIGFIGNVSGLSNLFSWIKVVSLGSVGAVVASRVLAQVLDLIANKIDENLKYKEEAKSFIKNKQIEKLDEKDISEEEMYHEYQKIAKEIDSKFPEKGREFWASVLKNTADIVRGSIGTTAAALSGGYLASKLTKHPAVETNDSHKREEMKRLVNDKYNDPRG